MLNNLNWPSLEQRSTYLKLMMFYKIIHDFVETLITLTPLLTPTTCGQAQCFTIPSVRTESYTLTLFCPQQSNYGIYYFN